MTEIRIAYTKTGDIRFISHLDVNRVFLRAVNRSKLKTWHTEGFNSHPYLNFAAPLSLGIESDREYLDLRLLEDMSSDTIAEKLNACLPDGIKVIEVYPAVRDFKQISFARYELLFDGSASAVEQFFSLPQIMCDKKSKSGIKTVDIRPLIDSVEICDGKIVMVLAAGVVQNLNPNLLATLLGERCDVKVRLIRRVELLGENRDLFK